jgi:hypothetical protein
MKKAASRWLMEVTATGNRLSHDARHRRARWRATAYRPARAGDQADQRQGA